MKFLNGKKTILGLIGIAFALAKCLIDHGTSLDAIILCAKEVFSGSSLLGASALLTALGVVHKVEKANASPS